MAGPAGDDGTRRPGGRDAAFRYWWLLVGAGIVFIVVGAVIRTDKLAPGGPLIIGVLLLIAGIGSRLRGSRRGRD